MEAGGKSDQPVVTIIQKSPVIRKEQHYELEKFLVVEKSFEQSILVFLATGHHGREDGVTVVHRSSLDARVSFGREGVFPPDIAHHFIHGKRGKMGLRLARRSRVFLQEIYKQLRK